MPPFCGGQIHPRATEDFRPVTETGNSRVIRSAKRLRGYCVPSVYRSRVSSMPLSRDNEVLFQGSFVQQIANISVKSFR